MSTNNNTTKPKSQRNAGKKANTMKPEEKQKTTAVFCLMPEDLETLKAISDEVPGKYSRLIDQLVNKVSKMKLAVPVVENKGGTQ